jgi:hypothetical protein
MAAVSRAALGKAMVGLAAFRIGLGLASWFAPRKVASVYGADETMTPELEYMTRVFAVRAIALGTGYLASSGEARLLWHRLWLLCDTADTVMGAGMVAKGQLKGPIAVGALATTAPAMALDLAALAASD